MRCVSVHWQITHNMGNESFAANLWPCNAMQCNAMQQLNLHTRYKGVCVCVWIVKSCLMNVMVSLHSLAKRSEEKSTLYGNDWFFGTNRVLCVWYAMLCRRHRCQVLLQMRSVREISLSFVIESLPRVPLKSDVCSVEITWFCACAIKNHNKNDW